MSFGYVLYSVVLVNNKELLLLLLMIQVRRTQLVQLSTIYLCDLHAPCKRTGNADLPFVTRGTTELFF